jgi:hypothetical protein
MDPSKPPVAMARNSIIIIIIAFALTASACAHGATAAQSSAVPGASVSTANERRSGESVATFSGREASSQVTLEKS